MKNGFGKPSKYLKVLVWPQTSLFKREKWGGGNLFLLTCKSVRVTVWMLKEATENWKIILEFPEVLVKGFNSETSLNIENIEELLSSILLSTHQISLQEVSSLQLLKENRHPKGLFCMFSDNTFRHFRVDHWILRVWGQT